jgi:hypothetical protein
MRFDRIAQTRILQPRGLDPRKHFPASLWKNEEVARAVLDHLIVFGAFRRDGDWVQCHHEAMAELLGGRRAWDRARNGLLDRGTIESDDRYWTGHQSKSYRLGPEWLGCELERFNLRDRRLAASVKAAQDRRARRDLWQEHHYHLERQIERATIDIDETLRWARGKPEWKRAKGARLIELIKVGASLMTLSRNTGRLFSVVTQLPRDLRRSLRIDGEPFVELDISNSQPLLLASINVHFFINNRRRKEKEESGESFSLSTNVARNDVRFWMIDGMQIDVDDFVDVCESGTFYEELAEAAGMPCETAADRDRVKVLAFRILFGRDRPNDPRWIGFKRRWPTMAALLAAIKADDHRNAARLLQKTESNLMVDGVGARLAHEHPHIPLLTIHDAVLTPDPFVETVRDFVLGTWAQVGLTPRLKVA